MTIKDLADEYGDLLAKSKEIDKRMKEIRNKLNTYKTNEYRGNVWLITKTVKEYMKLDTKLIKAEMGEPWISSHSMPVTQTKFDVSPVVTLSKKKT